MRRIANALLSLLLAGCTTIGMGDPASNKSYTGEHEKMRICFYKDSKVSGERAKELADAIKQEFSYHGIDVEVPWVREWERPAFENEGIIKDIVEKPLEYPCDRIMGIVGRDYKDFIWGIILPEICGFVEDSTMTKGYSVGEMGSLNQALSLKSPESLAVHEAYHLLGCGHGLSADPCYKQVQSMRKLARENRETKEEDFFPAMNLDGRIFWSRDEVDRCLGVPAGQRKE